MTVKNTTQKVINIGTTALMPDDTLEVSQAVANAPSIKAMVERGQLSLEGGKRGPKAKAADDAAEKAAEEAAAEEARKKAEEEAAAKAAAEAAAEAAKKAEDEKAAADAAKKAGKVEK